MLSLSGDTINVAAGTYAGAIVDKGVTISGAPGGASVITSGVPYKVGGPPYTTAFRLDGGADGAEISNFTINNNQGANFYFAVFARGADNVTIDSLAVNDTVQGITNWGGSGWTITNNTVTDTVAAGGGGIGIFLGATPTDYRTCSNNIVQCNIINATATADDYSCPGICACLDLRYGRYDLLDGTEDVSGNQILNNDITASGANNGVGVEVGTIIGDDEDDPDRTDPIKIAAVMAAAPVHDNTVQENTVDGTDAGIYFYNVTDLTATLNTIENVVGDGILAEHGQSGTVVLNNTFTNNNCQVTDTTVDTATLDPLDIASILGGNLFDRAVTVDHSGASLLHTIWSKIQDGIDAAAGGDTINVAAGTYNETLTFGSAFAKNNLTIQGGAANRPVVNGGVRFDNNGAVSGLTFANLYFQGTARATPNERIFWNNNNGAINAFTINNCVLDGQTVSGRQGVAGNKFGGSFTITNTEFKNILGFAVMDIDSSTAAGHPWGDNELPLTTVTFADNNVHDCNGSVALRGNYLSKTTQVSVYGNTFNNIGDNAGEQGEQWAAMEVNHAVAASVYKNTVNDVAQGIYGEGQAFQFWDVDTLDFYDNNLTNNYQGIFIFGGSAGGSYGGPYAVPGGSIHHNNIVGNDQYGISVESTATGGPLNAENNWWGANDGPSASPGSGDKISANVDADPWLVLNISADLTSIIVGGAATSTITADMTRNSDDVNTSAQGHIPDGTQITFTTDKGSIGSLTVDKTTTNGVATAALTSSNTVETATVTASAPPHTAAATANTTVEFVQSEPEQTGTATGTGTVTAAPSIGTVEAFTSIAEDTLPAAGKPAGVVFPHGLFSFNITGIAPGSTVTVTIAYPSSMPVGTQYWKCQGGVWVDCTSLLGDDDGDEVLTLTLTDGGLGDADGLANGTIVDPGGPGMGFGGGGFGGGGGVGGGVGGGGEAPGTVAAYTAVLTANIQGNITTAIMTNRGVLGETIIATDAAGKHRLEISKGSRVLLAGNKVPLLLIFRETSTTPPAPGNAVIVGSIYELNAYSSTFTTTPSPITISPPARLILDYDPDKLPKNVSEVFIANYDTEKGWLAMAPVSGVVAEVGRAQCQVSHFSIFAVLAKTTAPAPAKFNVGKLIISPSQAKLNQEVKVSVNVANTGGTSGSYILNLKVNGVSRSTKQVTVAAGKSQTVNFTVTEAQPGTYTVDIAGQSGSFVVLGTGATINAGLIAIVIAAVLMLATVVVLLLTFRRRAV